VGCRRGLVGIYTVIIKPFNAELNPIHHLLALLEAHHILHVSRIGVKPGVCTFEVVTKSKMTLFRFWYLEL